MYKTNEALSQELTATKPFASTSVTLSNLNLEPAAYSLPEPGGSGKRVILPPADTAALMVTSLPGCAARASMDILADAKPRLPADGTNPLCWKPEPTLPRDVDAVQDGRLAEAAVGAAAAAPLRQQHLKAQPLSPPPKAVAPRRSLHYDRDSNRARRNFRTSIDAADGAMTLSTCHVSEPPSPFAAAAEQQGTRMAAACDMPGCVPLAPTLPQPQAPRQAAAAAAAAAQMTEWSFGDDLQRARMLARYAAMTAADELRYEPSGGGGGDGDSDDDTVIEASRRSRSAWKLLSSLLSSSRGGSKAAATASAVQRWQEATTGGDGAAAASPAPVGGRGNGRRSAADDDTAVVVRSRDSRRLMRVQRSRVGIDREGQKQRPPGRASVPAFTQQPRSGPRQLHPRSSAPGMLTWDGREIDEGDEVNAAIIAAAAEFVAAAAERSP